MALSERTTKNPLRQIVWRTFPGSLGVGMLWAEKDDIGTVASHFGSAIQTHNAGWLNGSFYTVPAYE